MERAGEAFREPLRLGAGEAGQSSACPDDPSPAGAEESSPELGGGLGAGGLTGGLDETGGGGGGVVEVVGTTGVADVVGVAGVVAAERCRCRR